MKKKLLVIGLVALVLIFVGLAFVAKNASKLIKEKIETSMGKNVTVQDIALSWGGVDVTGVKVMKDGVVTVKADRIGIKADFFGFLKKGYALSSLTLDKPFIQIRIDRNGEFVSPIPVSEDQGTKKENKAASGKDETVAFSIGEIIIRDGDIRFQDDRRPEPMHTVGIRNLNLSLESVAWPLADKNSRLEVAALLEGKLIAGSIKAKGDLNLKTKAVKLQGEGQSLVLLDFKDKGPFAKSEQVALAVASSGSQYTFSDLTLKKPFLRVEADSQGKFINPFDAIEPSSQKPASPKSTKSAEAKADKTDETTILIQKMQVTDGALDYYNGKVSSPPHRTRLEAIQFSMDNIAVPASDKTSNYSFSANSAGGTIVSKGTTSLGSKDTNAVVTVRNLDVTQFKPYYQKKGDAAVTRGAMDLDLDLKIKAKMVNGPGKVVLKDLDFASGSGLGGQVVGVPRAAVVNLLKSNNNQISLDFTLQGNIDDPQFSIREALMKKLTVGLAEKLGASLTGIGSGVIDVGTEGVKQVGKGSGSVGEGLKKLFKK